MDTQICEQPPVSETGFARRIQHTADLSEDAEAQRMEVVRAATSAFLDRLVQYHPERARRLSAIIIPPLQVEPDDVPDIDFISEEEAAAELELQKKQADLRRQRGFSALQSIVRIVAKYHGLNHEQLVSARRDRDIVQARQFGYYLCSKLTRSSLVEIGRRFGGKDHTTVLHGLRVITQKIERDTTVASRVAALRAAVIEIHPWLGGAV